MCSEHDDAALPAPGFPIRGSTGQRPFNASPWLIAVVHALHRLLVPRHPPCALTILTVIIEFSSSPPGETGRAEKMPSFATCQLVRFSRTGEKARAQKIERPVSQNSAACGLTPTSGSVDILGPSPGLEAGTAGSQRELPRKEVIQPHLPVRLPCYDFTPITSPTFDGSLPCGLGHRLRVLPAFVV